MQSISLAQPLSGTKTETQKERQVTSRLMDTRNALSVRVLVLGDSGVGKTCLVSLLCSGLPVTRAPDWTVGCNVDVLVRRFPVPALAPVYLCVSCCPLLLEPG